MATRHGKDGAVKIHQDATLSVASLAAGAALDIALDANRHGWLQVARGSVALSGILLAQGDGAAISGEARLKIAGGSDAEILWFDLA
ncbi:MAG: hypothetical protein Q7S58_06960 [Candidatus Binatus sp.]|nr:hypothetical protein [Candidatus Binatus sp.]MDO8432138.1 hypothetical protein [Candidatus Binatus sp.]